MLPVSGFGPLLGLRVKLLRHRLLLRLLLLRGWPGRCGLDLINVYDEVILHRHLQLDRGRRFLALASTRFFAPLDYVVHHALHQEQLLLLLFCHLLLGCSGCGYVVGLFCRHGSTVLLLVDRPSRQVKKYRLLGCFRL